MHFGFILFVGTLLIAGALRVRAIWLIRKNPELRDGYNKLILGFILFMGSPWLVMEVGTLATNIPGILFPFMMREGNPFVLLFFAWFILEYVVYFYWVWFRNELHPSACA